MNRGLDNTTPYIELDSEDAKAKEGKMSIPASAKIVMVAELSERLAYYGVTVVLMSYLMNEVGLSQPAGNAVVNGFTFWAYAACLIGGYIGDSKLGKLRTILTACAVYTTALVLLTASALLSGWLKPTLLFPALFLIGCATGGIKANVLPLFADQLPANSLSSAAFRWFYWSINLGAFFGQLITPLLHSGSAYYYSFGLPALAGGVSLALLYAARGMLIDGAPSGTLLSDYIRTLRYAWAEGDRNPFGLNQSLMHALASSEHYTIARDMMQTAQACRVFLFFPLYWFAYNQSTTNYIPQAETLDRPDWMPAEWLNMLNALTLVILIPLSEGTLFPLLRRYNRMPTNLVRIIIGFVVHAAAIGCAALLQTAIDGRGYYVEGKYKLLNGEEMVSVWWQVPQFTLGAASEIFASVGGLEYAYSQAPASMKSVVMSLYLLTTAGGSLIGIITAPLMQPERMRLMFSLLCLAMFGMTAVFTFVFHGRMLDELEAEQARAPEAQNEGEEELMRTITDVEMVTITP